MLGPGARSTIKLSSDCRFAGLVAIIGVERIIGGGKALASHWNISTLLEAELGEVDSSAGRCRLRYLLLLIQRRRLVAVRERIADEGLKKLLDTELESLEGALQTAEKRLAAVSILPGRPGWSSSW